jgi:hypothetical protein
VIDEPTRRLDEGALRALVPRVLAGLVRQGEDFDAAGLRETDRLREVLGERHRWHAVRGHLHELSGDLPCRRRGVRGCRTPGHGRRRARPPSPSGRPRAGRRAR